MEGKDVIAGVVSSRKCSRCGHHEIGIVTAQGDFYPLRPGMYVQVFPSGQKETGHHQPAKEEEPISHDRREKGGGLSSSRLRPWVPEILRRKKRLRLKYGILVSADEGQVDVKTYKIAYIKKLQNLIEKEIYPSLAVILDNFFQSPHLASGDPAEVTINLLRDIGEIRRPVELMVSWLEQKSEDVFEQLIFPFSVEDMESQEEPVSDEEFAKELTELTFEEFLRIL
ncbi:MAG: hypothetical protein DRG39_00330 [Deltaproteobacteria bacterium]|nr:MAG: hypothetical protein DRG39_00330 [Deltaproteobacteria bacterium]